MRSVFSLPIYLQGLKRIRALGSCMAVFLLFINVVMTADINFDNLRFASGACKYCEKGLSHFDVFATDWMLVLIVIVPFVTYNMFSYLNRRSGADFYHALPVKRRAVFISQWAATLTWTLGSVALCVAVNCAWWIAEGAPLHFYVWFNTLVCTCALVLFLSACAALGTMLTGNALSATAATAAIILLPYCVTSVFEEMIEVLFPRIILDKTVLKYIGHEQFLPLRLYDDDVNNYTPDGGLLANAVYSLALSALACLAYVKRASEAATRPSTGKFAKHFIRGAVSFPLVAIAMSVLVNANDECYELNHNIPYEFGEWLSAALVTYLLCELIFTRSFKSTVKAVPWFLTVLAAGGLLFGAAHLSAAVMRANDPKDPAEIEDVVLYGYFYVDGIGVDNYDGVTVKSEKLIQTITESYSEPVKNFDAKINYKNGKTVWRKLGLKDTAYKEFTAYVMADSELNKIVMPLPKWENIDPKDCEPQINKEFWDTFTEEYYKLDTKGRRLVDKSGNDTYTGDGKYEYLTVEFKNERYNYWVTESYYVDAKKVPKSYKLLKELKEGAEA